MSRTLIALFLVFCMGAMLAACGDDDSSSDNDTTTESGVTTSDESTTGDESSSGDEPAADGQVIELEVDGNNLAFTATEVDAAAGTVTLRLTNDSSIAHNIAVKDGDTEIGTPGELVTDGGVSETTVELEAGKTYTYYCQPHEGAGMLGTLTVA